jgi:hypothetical protein
MTASRRAQPTSEANELRELALAGRPCDGKHRDQGCCKCARPPPHGAHAALEPDGCGFIAKDVVAASVVPAPSPRVCARKLKSIRARTIAYRVGCWRQRLCLRLQHRTRAAVSPKTPRARDWWLVGKPRDNFLGCLVSRIQTLSPS